MSLIKGANPLTWELLNTSGGRTVVPQVTWRDTSSLCLLAARAAQDASGQPDALQEGEEIFGPFGSFQAHPI